MTLHPQGDVWGTDHPVARADACLCNVTEAAGSPDAFLRLLPWESPLWHRHKNICSQEHKGGNRSTSSQTRPYFTQNG